MRRFGPVTIDKISISLGSTGLGIDVLLYDINIVEYY